MTQDRLSNMDANTIEARLNEITNKFNRAKQHIADQQTQLNAKQQEAEHLRTQADDAVPAR